MPTMPSTRISLKSGERLADVVPMPAGTRAEIAEFLEANGLTRDVATRSRLPAEPSTDTGTLTITLPAGYDVEHADGSVERLYDRYTRRDSEALDPSELRLISDALTLWDVPTIVAMQQSRGADVIRLDLVADERQLAR